MQNDSLEISIMGQGTLPRVPFLDLKNKILGAKYELSILFADTKTSRRLNRDYRSKDRATNMLSFSYSKTSGELVLHLPTIRKERAAFRMTEQNFITYLVIHGMLHLKGYAHGSTMETRERTLKKFFGVTEIK